jgi:hypothetical protein
VPDSPTRCRCSAEQFESAYVVEVLEQTSAAGIDDRTHARCSSSTRPAVSSDWASLMLPWPPMSPPGRVLRSRTTCATGPATASALLHEMVSGVEVDRPRVQVD